MIRLISSTIVVRAARWRISEPAEKASDRPRVYHPLIETLIGRGSELGGLLGKAEPADVA